MIFIKVNVYYKALEMAANLEFQGVNANTAAEQIIKLYNLFIAVDATQVNNHCMSVLFKQ